MINWKEVAKQDLRDYKTQQTAIDRLKKRIEMINERMAALKGAVTDAEPVQGGTSTYEDHLINAIVEKERLGVCLAETESLVEMIDDALASLSAEHRKVLFCFYMGGGGYRMAMEELHREKSDVYRMSNDALRMFTLSMYGIQEL